MVDELPSEIRAEVTFHLKDIKPEVLFSKAGELDDQSDEVEEYTIAQALQVIWHNDPEWFHENVLDGWTMDKASDDDGYMRSVWKT